MKFKKEIILIVCVLMGIIILEIVTNSISKKSADKAMSGLEKIVQYLDEAVILDKSNLDNEEFKENLKKEISSFKEEWFKEEKKLSIFTEHDELEKVSSCLIILEENARNEAYEIALENCAEFEYWLNHFKDKEKLVLKNIF